jgi:hypothetical protein
MACDLWAYASLGAKTGDGNEGGQDAADFCGAGWGGVREQGAVVAVQDVDGEVGVRLGELGEKFLGEGVVDGVPESFAAVFDGVDVGG